MKNLLRRSIPALLAPACVLLLSGCATMVRFPQENILIDSYPQGLTYVLEDGRTGQTPDAARMDRKKDHTVTVTDNFGRTKTENLVSVREYKWILPDAFFPPFPPFTGMIALAVDYFGYGAYRMDRSDLFFQFPPPPPPGDPTPPEATKPEKDDTKPAKPEKPPDTKPAG